VKILGIDPSLNATGWAIVESSDSGEKVTHSGVLIFETGGEVGAKIVSISHQLTSILKTHEIKIIAMEETIVNKNPSSSLKLGLVRGACIAVAALINLTISEYKPKLIKSTITGNGNADKSQVAFMLRCILGNNVVPTNHNESDAVAIALTHLLLTRNANKLSDL